jgi:hypothetical protein
VRIPARAFVCLALVAPLAVTMVVSRSSPAGATARRRGSLRDAGASDHPRSDFNGDGNEDLAIGAPYEFVTGVESAGVVHVLYAERDGLTSAGTQVISRADPKVASRPRRNDLFGETLASGDFDADGFDDLAASGPGYFGGGGSKRGSVNVLYGSRRGLTGRRDQLWTQDEPGIVGDGSEEDSFGWAMAVGDFDGDGYDDLSIGVPGDSEGGTFGAGGVQVLYGSADGLTAVGAQYWSRADPAVRGEPGTFDQFGEALAVGNFGHGSWDDLAIGVPEGSQYGHGGVEVLFGSDLGLTGSADELWTPETPGVRAPPSNNGGPFGSTLAAANMGGGPQDDLAIGSPLAANQGGSVSDPDYKPGVGAVNVLFATKDGLTAAGDQRWTGVSDGMPDSQDAWDELGRTLLAEDLDGDGWADLAVAADIGRASAGYLAPFPGVVYVLPGSTAGPTTTGVRAWEPGFDGLPLVTADSWFGLALGAGRYGTALPSLTVGAPEGNAAYVIGTAGSAVQVWRQGEGGIPDPDGGTMSFGFGSGLTP